MDLGRFGGCAFCLQLELSDEIECALLTGCGGGDHVEGRCIAIRCGHAAGVACDGAEIAEKRGEAVCGRAVTSGMKLWLSLTLPS